MPRFAVPLCVLVLLFAVWPSGHASARAETVELLNRIDPDPDVPAVDSTFGNLGDAMFDDGGEFWATPGTLIRDVPVDAIARQARFVVIGVTESDDLYTSASQFDPYDMKIHFWSGGFDGAGDSFAQNPRGETDDGHLSFSIPRPYNIADFDVSDFSFLMTVDLTPFGIELQEGRDYVMALVAENENEQVRNDTVALLWSNVIDEQDVFAGAGISPGFTVDEHSNDLPSYATSLSVELVEAKIVGDLTGNGSVDFDDLSVLLSAWDTMVTSAQGNLVDADSSPVDFDDLAVLLAHWTGPPSAAAAATDRQAALGHAVPEPSTLWLALGAVGSMGLWCMRRRTRATTSDVTSPFGRGG